MRKTVITLFLLLSISGFTQLRDVPSKPVSDYLEGRTAAMQADAVPANVEQAVSGLAADAVYEHPAFKAHIDGRENIRSGMLQFIGSTRNARLDVTKAINTSSVVVVEMQLSFEARKDDKWLPSSRRQVLLFELREGAIHRILEYWD
jgi:SnoaL-like protein